MIIYPYKRFNICRRVLDEIRKLLKKARRIDELGRITIPKEIRDKFNTDYFLIKIEDNKIILIPVKDISEIESKNE